MAAALACTAALPARAQTQPMMANGPEPIAALTLAGFYEMPRTGGERVTFERARALAIRILTESAGLETSLARLAHDTAGALQDARLFIAGDAEADRQCATITAALFVRRDFPGNIYICADTRWHVLHEESDVTSVVAQILIHEGAHLAGTADECQATALELVVAGNSVGISNYGNFHRYAGQCRGLLSHRALRRQGLRM